MIWIIGVWETSLGGFAIPRQKSDDSEHEEDDDHDRCQPMHVRPQAAGLGGGGCEGVPIRTAKNSESVRELPNCVAERKTNR